MKTKAIFLLPILFLFLLQSVLGQKQNDTANNITFKHALGVAAGFTTGYGLSYRFTPNKFGVQLTFAPYKNDETAQYSLGITFMYKIIESEFANFFLYQGNHFFYTKDKTYDYIYYYPNFSFTGREVVDKYWNNGIGIGIEFIILKRVSFNLMGGYAAYKNFENINITGETGLFFKF